MKYLAIAMTMALNICSTVLFSICADSDELGKSWVEDSSESTSLTNSADYLIDRKLWGFSNEKGELVIPAIYDEVDHFILGSAFVKRDGKVSYIDPSGKPSKKTTHADLRRHEKGQEFRGDIMDATGTKRLFSSADVELGPIFEGMAVIKVPSGLLPELGINEAPMFKDYGKLRSDRSIILNRPGQGLCGFINDRGWLVIPPQFTHAEDFQDGIAQVKKPEGEGYIDKSGTLLSGKYYPQVWDFDEGFAPVHDADGWAFIDRKGNCIIHGLQSTEGFSNGLAAVEIDDKWGFVDTTGRHVIPLKFEGARSFGPNLAAVKINNRWGFVNRRGEVVVSPRFVDVPRACIAFGAGLEPVAVNVSDETKLQLLAEHQEYHCGYVDEAGKTIVTPKFTGARSFSEGLAAVEEGIKWGFIDHTGKFVIKPQYEQAMSFSEGLAAVYQDSKWGFVNHEGKYVIPPRYPTTSTDNPHRITFPRGFSDGLALVEWSPFHMRFIDKDGNLAINEKSILEFERSFREGFAMVQFDGDWRRNNWASNGYTDTKGHKLVGGFAKNCRDFSEGLAMVGISEDHKPPKDGFIDRAGKVVIGADLDVAGDFHEGLAGFGVGKFGDIGSFQGKFGYIDQSGRKVIRAQFDGVQEFSEGLAPVKVGSLWGFIDKQGATIIPTKFEEANPFSGGRALIELEGSYGFIDKYGKVIIPAKYDNCASFSEGAAVVAVRISHGSTESKSK